MYILMFNVFICSRTTITTVHTIRYAYQVPKELHLLMLYNIEESCFSITLYSCNIMHLSILLIS